MKIVTEKQYTPEWWEARRGVPTASCFGRIITPAKGEYSKQSDGYVCELIAETFDPAYGPPQDEYVSAAMKNGTMLEPEARAFYEFDRGADVREVGLCMDDAGRFGTSPDGLVGDDGVVEIKSPMHKTQVAYLLDGSLPSEYKPQVHGHLVVTGRAWCDFLSYAVGLPPLLIRVERDEYTAALEQHLAKFWADYQAALAKVRAMQPTPQAEPESDEEPIVY